MDECSKRSAAFRLLFPLGVSIVAFLAVTKGPVADQSEIDAFQQAINSQTEADATEFIKNFGSSHLVPDLIELLQPDVARAVCTSVSNGTADFRKACERIKQQAEAAKP